VLLGHISPRRFHGTHQNDWFENFLPDEHSCSCSTKVPLEMKASSRSNQSINRLPPQEEKDFSEDVNQSRASIILNKQDDLHASLLG
jgi:hypothetical protein